jgi:GNAT superfamily N-acetyltransferase
MAAVEGLILRALGRDDLPALRVLEALAIDEGVRNVTLLRTAIEDGLGFDGLAELAFGAWTEDRLLGVGGLTPCPHRPAATRVRRFYVAAQARRRGVGQAIASACLAAAGDKAVTCNARASAAAAPFWEAMGFVAANHPGITHWRPGAAQEPIP